MNLNNKWSEVVIIKLRINNDNSNYKYITARIGLNYNIQFKKLKKNVKKEIKNKYETKN